MDEDRLVRSRPWRDRDRDGGERLAAIGTELERCADRDGQRDTGMNIDGFATAPHPAATAREEPNFFNRPMPDGFRDFPWRQGEMRHAAAHEPAQKAYLRAIRRYDIGGRWQVDCFG